MGDEQKEWQEKFAKNSAGTREIFRFGCAFAIWYGLGVGLSVWTGNVGYLLICFAVNFSFPVLTAYWQPAYFLLWKILGNDNIPPLIMPYKRNLWSYIPLAIRLVISIALLIKGIELLAE